MLNPVHLNSQQQFTQPSFFSRSRLLLLGSIWGALMVVAATALVGLVSPGETSPNEKRPEGRVQFVTPVQPDTETPLESSPTTDSEQPLPQFTTPAESAESLSNEPIALPLWMFGAIALSCAGGSLVITYALKQALTSRPQGRKVVRKKKMRKKTTRRTVARPHPVSTRRQRPQAQVPQPRPPQPSTQVTILPPDLSHPLDEGEEELTNLFDLRKRRSLSSLMQDL